MARIMKSKLTKLDQLIASLSVTLSQLNLTKLKLEFLKSDFKRKN